MRQRSASRIAAVQLNFQYLFVEGGNPNLKPARREYLFIELLESVHDQEAQLLLQIKDKKIKCRGLTYKLVKETFPELIP